MGCIYFKSKKRTQSDSKELIPQKKEYSWDKRPKLNPKDYTIENIVDATKLRAPGTVEGKQFIIQNCKDAVIYVLDHCNTVTIDDCMDCKIVLGPTKGSVFVRSCENCVVVAACGQFRARDCRKLTTYLCCASQPAIESCCKVRVGCCLLNYRGLKEQMVNADISPFNNQWNLVYDFTPVPGEGPNWRIVSTEQLSVVFVTDNHATDRDELSELDLILGDPSKSIIPLTSGSGTQINPCEDDCLVTVLPGPQQSQHANDIISAVTMLDGRFELVATRERSVGLNEAQNLLQGIPPVTIPPAVTQLQLIALHFKGHGCLSKCQQVVAHLSLSPEYSGKILASPNTKIASKQIQHFMLVSAQS